MREQLLRQLYCERKLSMMEVAAQLGVTHATVLYWLKKCGIARRSWSESAYVKFNPNGDPFHVSTALTTQQRELLLAGLLLYWAEGNKGKSAIRLANLDHRMLKLFVKFLREVCHIQEERLRVYVRLHKQFALSDARRYWIKLLALIPSQVLVYPHNDPRSQLNKQWSRYGIATVEFHSTKLKRWLDGAIDQYIDSQLGRVRRASYGALLTNGTAATGVTPAGVTEEPSPLLAKANLGQSRHPRSRD